MEGGLMMMLHSIVIGIIVFIILFYMLNQHIKVAQDRSILIGAIALIYMILFGHKLPKSINKNIM